MLCDYALHKFTTDTDNDITMSGTYSAARLSDTECSICSQTETSLSSAASWPKHIHTRICRYVPVLRLLGRHWWVFWRQYA